MLSNAEDNNVVKTSMYDELIAKVSPVDPKKLDKNHTITKNLKKLKMQFLITINKYPNIEFNKLTK